MMAGYIAQSLDFFQQHILIWGAKNGNRAYQYLHIIDNI